MASLNHRSRSLRRVYVKTPGGTTKLQFRKRKPSKAHCAGCGMVLGGVPRERPFKMKQLGKTQKRPERPYGGVLCSKCTRAKLIEKARAVK